MAKYTRDDLIAAANKHRRGVEALQKRSTIYNLNGWLMEWDGALNDPSWKARNTEKEAWAAVARRLEAAGHLPSAARVAKERAKKAPIRVGSRIIR